MKRGFSFLLAFAIMAGVSSCAVGRKLSFENKDLAPGFTTTKTATVVFQDQRPDVLAGKEKPSFCGHSNSSAQISYNIQTESGKPLADEFAGSMVASYNRAGAAADRLTADLTTQKEEIIRQFQAGNKERLLFFTIHKWESRATPLFSKIRYEVIYNLELNVYSKAGELLASASTQDILVDEHGAATSMKQMQEMADDVLKQQVAKMLNKEGVKQSL